MYARLKYTTLHYARTACGYAPVYHAVCPLTRYHIVRARGHKALCPRALVVALDVGAVQVEAQAAALEQSNVPVSCAEKTA
eukprot:COSAG06_NODE_54794_length_292_cov_14.652850_1_plen_80_part_10